MMSRAESDKLPAIPIGLVGSGEVAGSAPHLVTDGNLACPSLGAQGMRINAPLDAAQMPISLVLNLITGGPQAANFRGPFQLSTFDGSKLELLGFKPCLYFL